MAFATLLMVYPGFCQATEGETRNILELKVGPDKHMWAFDALWSSGGLWHLC
jgi:hypothetical protein